MPLLQGLSHQVEGAWSSLEAAQQEAAAGDPLTGGNSVASGLQLHKDTATGQEILGQVQSIVQALEQNNQSLPQNPDAVIVKDGQELLSTLEKEGHTLTYTGEQEFMGNVSQDLFVQTESNYYTTGERLAYGNITESELHQSAQTLAANDNQLVSQMEQTLQSDNAEYHLAGHSLKSEQLDAQAAGGVLGFIESNVLFSSSDAASIVQSIEQQDGISQGKQAQIIEQVVNADAAEAAKTGFFNEDPKGEASNNMVDGMIAQAAGGITGTLSQQQSAEIIVEIENQDGITLARQEEAMVGALQSQENWAKNYIQGAAPTTAQFVDDILAVTSEHQLGSQTVAKELDQVERMTGLTDAVAAKYATQFIEQEDQEVQAFNIHDPGLTSAQIKQDVEQALGSSAAIGGTTNEITKQLVNTVESETGIAKAIETFTTVEASILSAETQVPSSAVTAGNNMNQTIAKEATAIDSMQLGLTSSELATDVIRAYENSRGITAGMVEEAIYSDITTANSNETFISGAQVQALEKEIPSQVAYAMNGLTSDYQIDSPFVLQSREQTLNSLVQQIENTDGITNALNENERFEQYQNLYSSNLGKELEGIKYFDPALSTAITATLWTTTAVTALSGIASIASAGIAFFAAGDAAVGAATAAEVGTAATEASVASVEAGATAGTSTLVSAFTEVSNAVANTALQGMIQVFDGASQASITIADSVNAAANAVLKGMTTPLNALSAWSNATIDWARVVVVSSSSDATYAGFDVVTDDDLSATVGTQEAINMATAEQSAAEMVTQGIQRALPGPASTIVKMGLGLSGVSGFGGGVGGILRNVIEEQDQKNDEMKELQNQIQHEQQQLNGQNPDSGDQS